jgi:hypothetical protein
VGSTGLLQVGCSHNIIQNQDIHTMIGQYDRNGPQTTDLSWWLKPAMWETSGLNIGYWSEDCERWFLSYLDKCRTGVAELRKPSEWRHMIKFSKPVMRLTQKNDQFAGEFLAH